VTKASLEKALDSILDFEKLKYCFECGICTASCPVAELLPEHYNPRILLHSLPLADDKLLNQPNYGCVLGVTVVIDGARKT